MSQSQNTGRSLIFETNSGCYWNPELSDGLHWGGRRREHGFDLERTERARHDAGRLHDVFANGEGCRVLFEHEHHAGRERIAFAILVVQVNPSVLFADFVGATVFADAGFGVDGGRGDGDFEHGGLSFGLVELVR